MDLLGELGFVLVSFCFIELDLTLYHWYIMIGFLLWFLIFKIYIEFHQRYTHWLHQHLRTGCLGVLEDEQVPRVDEMVGKHYLMMMYVMPIHEWAIALCEVESKDGRVGSYMEWRVNGTGLGVELNLIIWCVWRYYYIQQSWRVDEGEVLFHLLMI